MHKKFFIFQHKTLACALNLFSLSYRENPTYIYIITTRIHASYLIFKSHAVAYILYSTVANPRKSIFYAPLYLDETLYMLVFEGVQLSKSIRPCVCVMIYVQSVLSFVQLSCYRQIYICPGVH